MSQATADPRYRVRAHAAFSLPAWLGLGVGIALAAFAIATLGAYSTADEAWFLRVVDRVVAGEDLYREVFYSPLPLAVEVTAVIAALVGVQAVVVDAVLAAVATATCLLVGLIALRVGCSRPAAAAAALATLVLAPPHVASPYGAFASAFSVATLAVLVGRRRLTTRHAVLAGALVGLAFASKQNIGGLIACAAVVGILIGGGRTRALLSFACGAVGTVMLVLVPVVRDGALGDVVDLGFTGKGEYLRVADVSYLAMLESAWLHLRAGRPLDATLPWLTDTLPVVLPLVALAAVGLALFLGSTSRRDLVIASAFGIAAFAGAYPRMDYVHLSAAAPCLVAATAAAWAQLSRPARRRLDWPLLCVVVAWVSLYVVLSFRFADQLTVSSSHAHLSGVRLYPASDDQGRRWAADLEPGMRVFVVRQDASFAYLVSGAENPTRFDYPASSNIGPDELREIARGIDDGTIPYACIGGPAGFLEPIEVDALVKRTMQPVRSLTWCDLYHARRR